MWIRNGGLSTKSNVPAKNLGKIIVLLCGGMKFVQQSITLKRYQSVQNIMCYDWQVNSVARFFYLKYARKQINALWLGTAGREVISVGSRIALFLYSPKNRTAHRGSFKVAMVILRTVCGCY